MSRTNDSNRRYWKMYRNQHFGKTNKLTTCTTCRFNNPYQIIFFYNPSRDVATKNRLQKPNSETSASSPAPKVFDTQGTVTSTTPSTTLQLQAHAFNYKLTDSLTRLLTDSRLTRLLTDSRLTGVMQLQLQLHARLYAVRIHQQCHAGQRQEEEDEEKCNNS